MIKKKSPESLAHKINKTIRAALGDDIDGVSVEDIINQFSPIYMPDYKIEIQRKPLSSIEGALISSKESKRSIILINEGVISPGRYNFTLAHEFGHFLMHLEQQESFSCSNNKVLGFSKNVLEIEANTFASQLILPNDIVRKVADDFTISLDHIYNLAQRRNASLSATGIACARISSRRIGFACINNGMIKWGAASDAARREGLYFKSGQEVPSASSSNFEDAEEDQFISNHTGVEGWSSHDVWKEDGFYSAKYDETYLLLFK